MFNVGGGEILVILLVALLVLGPGKLPEAARQVGNVLTQVRKMSSGFQNELRSALDEPAKPRTPAADPATTVPTDPSVDGADGPGEDASDPAVQAPAADLEDSSNQGAAGTDTADE